jgi:multimeric flavodoxin WrbA
MKVLGISGSPRAGSTTDQLVQAVLAGVEGCETEFVSLNNKDIQPCRACLGCVKTNVCVIRDDWPALGRAIVEADAYVVGGANYFNTLNGLTHCFLERWYQFRHREANLVGGRPAVAVGTAGRDPTPAIQTIRRFFEHNDIECIGDVGAQSAFSCFTCGYGEECKAGGIYHVFGPETKITEDIIPSLAKQPEACATARALGKQLSDRLRTAGVTS